MSQPSTVEAVEHYGALVLHVAWKILPNADEARDVFQETFLQYHNAITRGEQVNYPKAWLCRTAQNAAFTRLRQQRREVQVDQGAAAGQVEESKDLEQRLLLHRVRQWVAELPQRQRQVFALRNFEGWKFAEIAAALGCSIESARANEYKALKKIRAWLGEDWKTNSHE